MFEWSCPHCHGEVFYVDFRYVCDECNQIIPEDKVILHPDLQDAFKKENLPDSCKDCHHNNNCTIETHGICYGDKEED